eukprot:1158910-Pelagomonas_calceolata.AAC.5
MVATRKLARRPFENTVSCWHSTEFKSRQLEELEVQALQVCQMRSLEESSKGIPYTIRQSQYWCNLACDRDNFVCRNAGSRYPSKQVLMASSV